MSIYLTSDLHFCHNRDFLYSPRGFTCVEDMNNRIVSNWNAIIRETDDVYVLGDLMLNNDVDGLCLVECLRGRLHIVRGNHDSDRRIELYRTCHNVVEVENSLYLHYNGYHFYLTHYPTITSNFDFDKPLKARLINLCGHSHIQDPFEDWTRYNAPIYHCELDAHNNEPVSLDDILCELQKNYHR